MTPRVLQAAVVGAILVVGLGFQGVEFFTHGAYTTPPLIGTLCTIAVGALLSTEGAVKIAQSIRADERKDDKNV